MFVKLGSYIGLLPSGKVSSQKYGPALINTDHIVAIYNFGGDNPDIYNIVMTTGSYAVHKDVMEKIWEAIGTRI